MFHTVCKSLYISYHTVGGVIAIASNDSCHDVTTECHCLDEAGSILHKYGSAELFFH